jgi:hypothetical protein
MMAVTLNTANLVNTQATKFLLDKKREESAENGDVTT